jgi:hypothetical protein
VELSELGNVEGEVKSLRQIATNWLLNRDEYVETAISSSPVLCAGIEFGYEDVKSWVSLIEEIEAGIPKRMLIFLQLRRQYRSCAGRVGWTTRMQSTYPELVAKECGTSPDTEWVENRHTFKNWWNNLVNTTTILAAKRGLYSTGGGVKHG